MDRDEALRLLKGGEEGVAEWNRMREVGEAIPSLRGANLTRANLHRAALGGAHLVEARLFDARLSEANLGGANLRRAHLRRAHLNGAHLVEANLSEVQLGGAHLGGAHLSRANLSRANLSRADLSRAHLSRANLSRANLSQVDLREAHLVEANLSGANLGEANLEGSVCQQSVFGDVDLSSVRGLEAVKHKGPSTVGTDTLYKSQGKIPNVFLRGCGLSPWETEIACLHDPRLSCRDVEELLVTKVFQARSAGPLFIGGVFISYSRADARFVDKIHDSLYHRGASVWLDRQDAVAGPLKEQVGRAIRLNDVVLLVLSENSVDSDWVENELEMARKKEKDEKRDVLCPVALDDSWKGKIEGDPLWRQLQKKLVLDFSGWKTKKFGPQFEKLVKGLKIYYQPGADGAGRETPPESKL